MARPKTWPRLALIVLAALLGHGFCLRNPWYMDDPLHLLDSDILHGGDWWDAGWRRWSYLVWSLVKGAFGMTPVAFHALNLLLHAGVAVTVFFVVRRLEELEGSPVPPVPSPSLATMAALLFAVHPAASEPVHYAAQTTIQWVTLFSMLAALATLRWLQNPSRLWHAGLALLWIVLAANSKEAGLFHAGIGVALIVGAFAPWRTWSRLVARQKGKVLVVLVLVVVAGSLFFVYSGWLGRAKASLGKDTFDQHVLTQCRMTWRYLSRTVLPVNLCSDHLVAVSLSRKDDAAVAGGVGIVVLLLVVAAGFFVRKRRFVALLTALSLAPLLVRFLYPVSEHLVEYRLYPAMPWFAILYAFALQGIANRKGTAVARFLPYGVVACLAILSVMRARDWRSPFSIGENVLSQYPDHVRVHSYLQACEMQAGEPEKAIARQAKLRQAAVNLRAYNKRWARHHRRYEVHRVLSAVMSGEQMAGMAEIRLGRPRDALRRLDASIAVMKINTRGKDRGRVFGVLYRTRGMAHAVLGNPVAARADLERARERIPGDRATLEAIRQLEAGAP